jgi:sugar phosphate isomerase/epimerase
MTRPITLFTGQWADLPLDTLCEEIRRREIQLDGLELACWGDHFDVEAAAGITVEQYLRGKRDSDSSAQEYCSRKRETLEQYDLGCWAISNHLVGQATLDLIDPRNMSILPDCVKGSDTIAVRPGFPGYDVEAALRVNNRACAHMALAAIAARNFSDAGGSQARAVVNGFTGSSTWALNYDFPPAPREMYEAGYQLLAKRWNPILDEFERQNAVFGLEVHPTEIAFDIVTAEESLKALDHRKEFGFNFDPSHLTYAALNPLEFLTRFRDRIYHVHAKDATLGEGSGTVSVLNNGPTRFGDPRRFWNFKSVGRGNVNFRRIMEVLTQIEYVGPISIEWEHQGMDRFHGVTESLELLAELDFPTSFAPFDAAFATK